MRIRLGPFSAVIWLYYLWLLAAFWIADLLGIRRHWFMWFYVAGHGIVLYVVGNWLEKKLMRTDSQLTRSPLHTKLTVGRLTVLVAIAVMWAVEYFVLLRYFPQLLTETRLAAPVILLCVPLLLAVTVLEAIWTRQIEP